MMSNTCVFRASLVWIKADHIAKPKPSKRRVPRRWSACKIIRLHTDSVQLSPWPFQGRTLQVFLPESAFVLFAQETQKTQCDQMLILVAPVNPCGSCQDIPFHRTATKQFRSCTHGTRIACPLVESKRRLLTSNHKIIGNNLILMASAAWPGLAPWELSNTSHWWINQGFSESVCVLAIS